VDNQKRNVFVWIGVAFLIVLAVFTYGTFKMVKSVVAAEGGENSHFEGNGNLAVMKLEGVIMNGEEEMSKLRELEEDKDIKAVVVRIDSPGGAVAPSQEIFDAIRRLRVKKTVVCSMGDLAASGGYYVASACEKIFANAGTLTGSIGVIMHFMGLKDLYAWAKVQPNIIKAGKFKDIGSDSRAMTEDERNLLQSMINEVHRQFKDSVLLGRNANPKTNIVVPQSKRLDPAVLEELADGRIFSGRFAKEKGFVDEIGGEYEAIEEAKKLAKIEHLDVVREGQKRKGLRSIFDSESRYGAFAPFASLWQKTLSVVAPSAALDLKPGVPYLLPAYMFEAGANISAGGAGAYVRGQSR
jgi:protease IV